MQRAFINCIYDLAEKIPMWFFLLLTTAPILILSLPGLFRINTIIWALQRKTWLLLQQEWLCAGRFLLFVLRALF